MSRLLANVLALSLTFSLLTSVAWAAPTGDKLNNDLRYLVGRYAKYGNFAVAVINSNGVRADINGRSPYPLASVFKLPLLVAIQKAQTQEKFPSMEAVLTVSSSDQCIGSGTLAQRGLGAKVTVWQACQLMMSISDNTATDLLFRLYGPAKLGPQLTAWGYSSTQIFLTNRQAWLLSLGRVPGWGNTSPEDRVRLWNNLNHQQQLAKAREIEQAAATLSLKDFQQLENSSTGSQSEGQDRALAAQLDNKMSALDLAQLLIDLDSGKLLGSEGRQTTLKIMAGQKYHSRLPAKLSPSTTIYHKTGSLSGVINDVGLMFRQGEHRGTAIAFLSQNVTKEAAATDLASRIAQLVEQSP